MLKAAGKDGRNGKPGGFHSTRPRCIAQSFAPYDHQAESPRVHLYHCPPGRLRGPRAEPDRLREIERRARAECRSGCWWSGPPPGTGCRRGSWRHLAGRRRHWGCFSRSRRRKARTGSAGWYNSAAFEKAAHADGLYAKSLNGDAFSDPVKQQVIDLIKADLGQVDAVIYSLASPRRTHPKTGETFKSTLKPIGAPYTAKTVDTDKGVVNDITIEPASEQEIADTMAVMGGEDWEMWIDALQGAGVLAEGATTVAYSYIGPKITWDIYRDWDHRAGEGGFGSSGAADRGQAGAERARVCLGEQGAGHAGEFGHPGGAAIYFAALQSDEGKGAARGVHRADRAAFCGAAL